MSESTKNNDAEKFVQDLCARGLIADITSKEDLITVLKNKKRIYFGIDPTADFLHLGHYLPLTIVKRFLLQGYDVAIVLGDLTAQIGDPSFRSKSRTYSFDVFKNTNSLALEIRDVLKNSGKGSLQFFKNTDFLNEYLNSQKILDGTTSIIWFLKNLCSQIKVSDLIHKDFIRDRLNNGLTLSEFCYPILQAWDFLFLYQKYDVCVQMGGKDQWTNILAGSDLINKSIKQQENSKKPVGFTFPILADSSGKKFGKSDGNAIKISVKEEGRFKSLAFQLFQYLINLDDALVLDYAKMLTFKDISVIEQWNQQGQQSLKRNFAYEVCKDIYGSDSADYCENISTKLFAGDVFDFSWEDFSSIILSIPFCSFQMNEEVSLSEAFLKCNLVTSTGEFKRLWKQKGIKVFTKENKQINSFDYKLGVDDSIKTFNFGNNQFSFLVLKKGQKSFGLIVFMNKDFPSTFPPALE